MKRPGTDFAAAVLFLLTTACTARSPGVSVGAFEIDPSPEATFLTLRIRPGLTKEVWRYSFFGDGEVRFDALDRQDPPMPVKTWTTRLTNAEMEGLLSDLVNFGLLELDPDAILKLERSEGKYRSRPSDPSSIQFSMAVLRRRWGGLLGPESVKHRFSLGGEGSPVQGPEIAEFEAYRRVWQRASELRRRAVLVPKPRPLFAYALPLDDRPVAVLTSTGVGIPVVTSMTLFGSGRAVVHSRGRRLEVQLPMDQVERVLRDVEEGGLASFDERSRAMERERFGEGASALADPAGPWPTFTSSFRLVGAAGTESAGKEVSREFLVTGASRLAQRFPSIPGYKALADLEELLFETESFALSFRRDP